MPPTTEVILPTISDPVHYADDHTGECRAATITGIRLNRPEVVDLTVFYPATVAREPLIAFERGVFKGEPRAHATWHYPDR